LESYGKLKISFEHYALDFKKDYYVIGFTKTKLKLFYINNGNKKYIFANIEIYENGKIVLSCENHTFFIMINQNQKQEKL